MAEIYHISCGGVTAGIIPYGAALQSLLVPDREGKARDIVLGFDDPEDYKRHDKFFGAVVGRFANRIGGASFEIDGETYRVAVNDGANHLHGGIEGFDKREWEVLQAGPSSIMLKLSSPDGDEGYPGDLEAAVKYSLVQEADGVSLAIEYRAVCDKPTLCNLTNHSYFNLAGHDAGYIGGQLIMLEADEYTPAGEDQVPDGRILPVEGTPMDLRVSTPIGRYLNDDFDQIRFAGGYDRNWVVRGEEGLLRPAAMVYSDESGILMRVMTDQPGIQFYTGNFLDDPDHIVTPAGKGGAVYTKQCAFCLETQGFPDAIHHPGFPDPVLRPGMEYVRKTVYHYSVVQAADKGPAAE